MKNYDFYRSSSRIHLWWESIGSVSTLQMDSHRKFYRSAGACPLLGNIYVLSITAKDSGYQVDRRHPIVMFGNILLLIYAYLRF